MSKDVLNISQFVEREREKEEEREELHTQISTDISPSPHVQVAPIFYSKHNECDVNNWNRIHINSCYAS